MISPEQFAEFAGFAAAVIAAKAELPIPVECLRYLSASLQFSGRGGLSSCLQRSMALALDLPQAIITFGTLRAATPEEIELLGAQASAVPFIHCWCEIGERVLAPTTIERTDGMLVPMDREGYYRINGVRDVRPVPRAAFDAIARRHRLASALRHGSPRFGSRAVSTELLAAAGVRYVLGEHSALLPAEVPAERRLTSAP